MKENKHIDRIFQEKLKNFEATPKDAVWERINAELHDTDSGRKVIPVWWKIAGIAASLLLMLTVGNLVLNNNTENSNDIPTEVVDIKNDSNTSEQDKNDTLNSEEKENTSKELLNNNLIPDSQTASSKGENTKDSYSKDALVKNPSNNNGVITKDAVVNSNKLKSSKSQNTANTNDVVNRFPNSDNTSLAGTQQNAKNKTSGSQNKSASANNNTVANNEIPQNLPEQPTSKNNISNEIKDASISKSNTKDAVVATNISKDVEEEEKDINNNTDEAKSPIEEAIATSEDGEDFNEKEKKVIDRWSVAANVSPVYYNTLGKGSSIHDQFNNNTKKGQLNMAYGVNASYAISDKLSVRSGIGKVNIGYNTNDIVVYNSLLSGANNPQPIAAANGAVFRNIDLKEEAQGITVISGETLAFAQVPGVVAQNLKSTLNQEISFIEIPVELEYKVSDKKLGVSLIGGFSTMILEENQVYTELNEERTVLGEANNINSVSYSANVGVGLGIKISEKINLNFEPTFKYQIRTFNNTTGDFKPYILGVSSGLKFKF